MDNVDFEFDYSGVTFRTRITREQYILLQRDSEAKADFFRQVYENFVDSPIPLEIIKNNKMVNCASGSKLCTPSTSTQYYSAQNENMDCLPGCSTNPPVNTLTSVNKRKTEKEKFVWDSTKTNLLLDIRLNMETIFNKPSSKKQKLWKQVCEEFNAVGGYNCLYNELYEKYRNLLQTYRINKSKKMKSGEESVKWEFFEKIDNILGNKANVVPPPNTLGGSFIENTSDQENEERKILCESGSSEHEPKKEISMKKYLYLKLQRDKEYYEHKKQKWQEKKELKKQEIDVLRDLVNVLKRKRPSDSE